MPVIWTKQAENDLDRAFDYLLEHNPAAAWKTYDRVHEKVDQLGTQPGMGRPGRSSETRELLITGTPYIVAYTADANSVIILRVLHSSQQWPDVLDQYE